LSSDESQWRRVAAVSDLAPNQPFGARLGEQDIVLVLLGGSVHALAGICPHAYALMCDGFIDGQAIECPLHAAIFDIRTGKCLDGPSGTGDLATFEVKVVEGQVWVCAS
jgi:nitrite reductase/ring-hydroxylating ferredoxin subunit